MNNQTVNAKVSLFGGEAWEYLGGIPTIRETFGAVTKSASVKSVFLHEINFAFAFAASCSIPNDNINTDTSERLTFDSVSNIWRM
jgi:hypothetical protein